MDSKAIDPVGFREAQHKQWESAAVGWKEWSEFSESAYGHISGRLVELADVQAGSRVLDVAAGYGEPALTAARKAGPEGRVVATDIAAEMLAFARERAATAGLGNLIRAMIEQHAGAAQEEAWDAITQAAASAGGASKPLRFSNVVLLASATA